jgi:hypothetical protein
MGDFADDVLTGDLCQDCGGWIDENSDGIPRFCKACHPKGKSDFQKLKVPTVKKIKCTLCDRHLKPNGMKDHLRDFHQIPGELQ